MHLTGCLSSNFQPYQLSPGADGRRWFFRVGARRSLVSGGEVRGIGGAPGAIPPGLWVGVGVSSGRARTALTARGLRASVSGLRGEVSDSESVFLVTLEHRLLQAVSLNSMVTTVGVSTALQFPHH